ncbi:MAG: PqqD family protein [Candidatus Izemoplasmatales bacterium]
MKIKKDYVIKTIGEDIVVVPVRNEAVRFNGIITLNKTGKFLFELLQNEFLNEEELLGRMLDNYDVDINRAKKDIEGFIEILRKNNLLDEESF